MFFALWPDEAVRHGLTQARKHLDGIPGRLTHPQDLHVTLVFLGAVEPEWQACAEAVAGAVEAKPFELLIERFGYWSRPRIVWCGPAETPDDLKVLVRTLQRRLKDCGLEPERRPYAAHVTLARKAPRVHCPELVPPLLWSVREFVLVASCPDGTPPRYRVLRRWPLGMG